MTRFLQRLRLSCLRPLMVWVLVLALPVHGVSNVLLQVMGAAHRHNAGVQHTAALDAQDAAHAPWNARAALRSLVASVAGTGALQLIDTMHARDHAWQRAAELKAHPFAPPTVLAQPRADAMPSAVPGASQQAAQAHERAHQHAHDTFQRHIHDLHDGTVVALGEHTQAPDAAGSAPALDAGGGTFPLAPVPGVQALAPGDGTAAWRRAEARAWRSHVVVPLERPPQA